MTESMNESLHPLPPSKNAGISLHCGIGGNVGALYSCNIFLTQAGSLNSPLGFLGITVPFAWCLLNVNTLINLHKVAEIFLKGLSCLLTHCIFSSMR